MISFAITYLRMDVERMRIMIRRAHILWQRVNIY